VKFVVSTTSVLPSHRPTESPSHRRHVFRQVGTAVERNASIGATAMTVFVVNGDQSWALHESTEST